MPFGATCNKRVNAGAPVSTCRKSTDLAANILKVDVDAIGCHLLQGRHVVIGGLVVERSIIAKLLGQQLDLQ